MNDLEQHTDVLSLIRVRMSGLSKGHKRIAEYILANYEKCAFLTAAKLGEVVGVSESTAVRFPAALGFSGYPEFQKALEDILQEKIHSFDRIDVLNSHMTTNMVVNNVMSMDARKIEHTLKSFDTASFDMAVEDIMAAESVYIIGIGISFPRYSMRTLKAMEFANNRKARVIAITDSVHSPMNMYSSCNLFARSDMASIVDSLVAPMSLINALIVSICLKNSEQVVENIEKINTFVDNFEYSGNDEINMLDENVVNELRKCMDNTAIDEEK